MYTQLLPIVHKMLGHSAMLVSGFGALAVVDFSHTVTLGSILIAFIILIVSGIFTVRSKIATIWRQEAEGERAAKERLEEQLAAEKAGRAEDMAAEKLDRAAFEREQQELRHDLKDELVACKAQLKVMEAKTDLTAALDAIQAMNAHTTDSIVAAMHKTSLLSEQRDGKTQTLLEEIRDKLPEEPVDVHAVPDKPTTS